MEMMLLLAGKCWLEKEQLTVSPVSQQCQSCGRILEDKAVILHLNFMKQVRKNNFPGHYGKNGPSPKLFIPKKKSPH